MSRAFVKETDAETPVPPERPVSLHPNFVTAEGLPAIEAELARLDKAHAAAVRAEDREAIALTQRDQRYWTARRASAQVVGAPPADGYVHFGSVVTLTRVGSLDEAIGLANSTRYGLQAGIFTTNIHSALEAARHLEFGGVIVNEAPTFRADQMPYGGVKASGNTREGPAYAVRELTEERLVVIDL